MRNQPYAYCTKRGLGSRGMWFINRPRQPHNWRPLSAQEQQLIDHPLWRTLFTTKRVLLQHKGLSTDGLFTINERKHYR
jgi:hypothetical protein